MNTFIRSIVRNAGILRSPLVVGNPNFILRTLAAENEKKYDKNEINKIVKNSKVVIFMKGTPEAPRCGFSNAVVQIMRMHDVKYDSHDVLSNEDMRQGIKDFTNWPTIPQVFINGEFVGGCDILLQMHQSGDLVETLQKCGIKSALIENSPKPDDKPSSKNKDK